MISLKTGADFEKNKTEFFSLRMEQKDAINKTANYFLIKGGDKKFLWNAKMRFGKTFSSYKLCEKMNLKKILIVTFMPAVSSSWSSDLWNHQDFSNWTFIDAIDEKENLNIAQKLIKPLVLFVSFQNLLGKDAKGDYKKRNKAIFSQKWDIVIFDEYHHGSWREKATGLFNVKGDNDDLYWDEDGVSAVSKKINARYRLYLSGTPFRALSNGEFIEEQIYNWTYLDEQNVKNKFAVSGTNPYEELPQMKIYLYQLPNDITELNPDGREYDGFSLNKMFSAQIKEGVSTFEHPEMVEKWLDLVTGGNRKKPRWT